MRGRRKWRKRRRKKNRPWLERRIWLCVWMAQVAVSAWWGSRPESGEQHDHGTQKVWREMRIKTYGKDHKTLAHTQKNKWLKSTQAAPSLWGCCNCNFFYHSNSKSCKGCLDAGCTYWTTLQPINQILFLRDYSTPKLAKQQWWLKVEGFNFSRILQSRERKTNQWKCQKEDTFYFARRRKWPAGGLSDIQLSSNR